MYKCIHNTVKFFSKKNTVKFFVTKYIHLSALKCTSKKMQVYHG